MSTTLSPEHRAKITAALSTPEARERQRQITLTRRWPVGHVSKMSLRAARVASRRAEVQARQTAYYAGVEERKLARALRAEERRIARDASRRPRQTLGRPLSDAHRAAVSAGLRAHGALSPEHRAAISRANSGVSRNRGQVHSPEHRAATAAAQRALHAARGPRDPESHLCGNAERHEDGILARRILFARHGKFAECSYCGRLHRVGMGDHVVPFSHGGRATEDNLVAACQGCNNSKCDRTPEQWLADGLRAS